MNGVKSKTHQTATATKTAVNSRSPQLTVQTPLFDPSGITLFSSLSPDYLLTSRRGIGFLQRTAGNRAVRRLIQTKLTVGKPGDKYEQEADRVAKRFTDAESGQPTRTPVLPQNRLTIASYPVQRQSSDEEKNENSNSDSSEMIQAKSATDLSTYNHTAIINKEKEDSIDQRPKSLQSEKTVRQPGPGRVLDSDIRNKLETGMGADFSGVRVHSNTASQQAETIGARAFTSGPNIHLRSGESQRDIGLMAHKTAHVVQQSAATITQHKTTVQENASDKEESRDRKKQNVDKAAAASAKVEKGKPVNDEKQAESISSVETHRKSSNSKQSQKQLEKKKNSILSEREQVQNGADIDANDKSTRVKQNDSVTAGVKENLSSSGSSAVVSGSAIKQSSGGASISIPENVGGSLGEGPDATAEETSTMQKMEGSDKPSSKDYPEEVEMEENQLTDQDDASSQIEDDRMSQELSSQDGISDSQAAMDSGNEKNVEIPENKITEESTAESESSEVADAETGGNELQNGESPQGEDVKEDFSPQEHDTAIACIGENAVGSGESAIAGGGGGGAPIEEPEQPQSPDVSTMDPTQAIVATSRLSPVQQQQMLSSVGSSVSNSVDMKRKELAENPPQIERPSGSPVDVKKKTSSVGITDTQERPARVTPVPQGQNQPTPKPESIPQPPVALITHVCSPQLQDTAEGQMSAADASKVQNAISQLPTSDPALSIQAVSPPPLELSGNADPSRVTDQKFELGKTLAETSQKARQNASQPMGEDNIYPSVPQETLKAQISTSGSDSSPGGAQAPAKLGVTEGVAKGADPVSIIAQQQHGKQIRAAASNAQMQMVAQREEHAQRASQERERSREEMDRLQNENSEQQTEARSQARSDVANLKQEWTVEQEEQIRQSDSEAEKVAQDGQSEVSQKRQQGESEAATLIEEGNSEAGQARLEAESEASRQRQRGKNESSSGGILGWVASKAKAFFDGIKNAIQAAFERARKLVRAAIERAQKLAVQVIERARQAIVSIIQRVGDALIAIGDKLLAGFPALRDRFRKAIKERVSRAETLVNRLAEKLKQGIQKALDLLGKALNSALGLLEKGLLAVVNTYRAVVMGAINAAKAVVDAFGAFAVLISHIAANPGQWIRNLGSAIMDGLRNYFWNAFKTAVKNWFNSKLEEVLGLGTMIWNLLTKGGIKIGEIGKMVWEGLKAAIPIAIVQILIEKLVAMIVPAAGAILTIIEGLRAAWGTVQRVIQAFQLFFVFLKAVRTGNAGPHFARALAAAAVVVIDFIANWLLMRLRKPAGRIGGRIKAIAQKIAKKVGKAVKGVVKAVKKGAKKAAGAVKRGVKKVANAVGKVVKKVTSKIKRAVGKVKSKFKKWRDKRRQNKADRKRAKEARKKQEKQERLDNAVRAIKPQLEKMLSKGTSSFLLRARLFLWKIRYRLSSLTLSPNGSIVATVNPSVTLTNGKKVSPAQLGRLLQPIFEKAELEYERRFRENDPAKKEYEDAEKRFRRGEANSLEGVPRDVQQKIIREGERPPLTMDGRKKVSIEVENGVTVVTPPSIAPSQMTVAMGKGESYEDILQFIRNQSKSLGIPEVQIARMIHGDPRQLNSKISSLSYSLKTENVPKEEIQTLMNRIRRTAFLTQALEPARARGIATSNVILSGLVGSIDSEHKGKVLGSMLSPSGRFGPMTFAGASGTSKHAEQLRKRKIGNIIAMLLNESKKADIIAAVDADLKPLAEKIESWLMAKINKDKVEESLIAEIVLILSKYNGRNV